MELFSVVKRDELASELAFWKFPAEDFRKGSQLIVGEDDFALFYKEGVIVETFSGGKYKLETRNYPFVDRLLSSFSGGENAFNCKVFFVNGNPLTNMKWGTRDAMEILAQIKNPNPALPPLSVPVKIRALGNYTVRIVSPKQFVLKFAKTSGTYTTNEELNARLIRPAFMEKVTDAIGTVINGLERSVFDVQSQKGKISASLCSALNEKLTDYGMRLDDFYVESITIEETEQWQKFKQAWGDMSTKMLEALGNVGELNLLGNEWQKVQQRNILTDIANNPSQGGVAGLGAALGVGLGMVNVGSAMTQGVVNDVRASGAKATICPSCGVAVNAGRFCPNCGKPLHAEKQFCTSCGAEIASGTRFCANCGTKQG